MLFSLQGNTIVKLTCLMELCLELLPNFVAFCLTLVLFYYICANIFFPNNFMRQNTNFFRVAAERFSSTRGRLRPLFSA